MWGSLPHKTCLACFPINKMEIILELSSQNCCEDKIQLIHKKLPSAGFLEKTESFTLKNTMHSTLPLLWGLVTLTSRVSPDVLFRQTPDEPPGHKYLEGTPIQELRLELLSTLQGRKNWPEVGWRSPEWAKSWVQMLEVEPAGPCPSNIIPSKQPFLQRPLF